MTRRIGFPEVFRGLSVNVSQNSDDVPELWTPRGRWKSGAMHTFCDDYRQEFFFRRPEEGLLVALAAGVVTAPDFTAYTNDPLPWRVYQAWRSALVASYWQQNGVTVYPVVSFDTGCEQWVQPGSVWAIRGGRGDQWTKHVNAWTKKAKPKALIVFGCVPEDDLGCKVYPRRLLSSKGSAAQKEGGNHGR